MSIVEVAQVWRIREKVEHEASALFAKVARGLSSLGENDAIVELARQAARDEIEHARLCRAIVDRHTAALTPLAPLAPLDVALGPRDLSARERAIYEAVALGCVTESLSTALLLEIERVARDEQVAETAHRILRDEIQHARLGWAVLASEHRRGSTTAWLAPHIQPMIEAALADDLIDVDMATSEDLRVYGILPRQRVRAIAAEVVREVIEPGLVEHGIPVNVNVPSILTPHVTAS